MQPGTSPDNGIDLTALKTFSAQVSDNPVAGMARFGVITSWKGGTRTQALTAPLKLGDRTLERHFVIDADEPEELLGTNNAPNPQELLLAALNACMSVGYVATAASMGIELNSLKIHTQGTLDLRGFLGLDTRINPGYDSVDCEVEIASSAHPEKLEALHETVRKTSPNFNNFVRAIELKTRLTVKE